MKIDPATEKRIQARLQAGMGIIKAAREIGVGVATVQRIKAEMDGARPFDGAGAAAEPTEPRPAS